MHTDHMDITCLWPLPKKIKGEKRRELDYNLLFGQINVEGISLMLRPKDFIKTTVG